MPHRRAVTASSIRAGSCVALAIAAVAMLPGAQADRRMAVTIDDLPANCTCADVASHAALTKDLLAGLSRHDVPAVGFVNESKLYPADERTQGRGAPPESGPDAGKVALLEAWLEAGLELGNHSYSHPDLHRTPLDAFEQDVLLGEIVMRELYGARGGALRFFRHPMLHTGRDPDQKRRFERFLADHSYRIAPVTIDNSEWIFARAYDHALDRGDVALATRVLDAYLPYMDEMVAFYERQSRDLLGREIPQVLLLHANRLNAAGFDRLARAIRGRGYRFVPLDEALRDPAYRRPDEYVGSAGLSWIQRWAMAEGKGREFFAGEPRTPQWVLDLAGISSE